MANSEDPDQTVPIGAVCSGSTLFASILVSNVRQLFAADDFYCGWRFKDLDSSDRKQREINFPFGEHNKSNRENWMNKSSLLWLAPTTQRYLFIILCISTCTLPIRLVWGL